MAACSAGAKTSQEEEKSDDLPSTLADIKSIKLTYFGLPGRGEGCRLLAFMGGLHDKKDFKWEDERTGGQAWKDVKMASPWTTCPFLTVGYGDKTLRIGQNRAITRYMSRMTGFYPENPSMAAQCDELQCVMEDLLKGVFGKKGKEEREEFWKTGYGKTMMNCLSKAQKENGSEGHMVGKDFTLADVVVFQYLTNFTTGMIDHTTRDLVLKDYPNLEKVLTTMGGHAGVQAFYKAELVKKDCNNYRIVTAERYCGLKQKA